ncbi:DUF2459 domain-containing protein [Xanthobacter autotrophicus DSM 431]|uniref:DUF2459 domain-containing protein n=1 Tax=Xanthobacter nonsaccharivorans TaxID=3119912 RepID=UPI00372AC2BE
MSLFVLTDLPGRPELAGHGDVAVRVVDHGYHAGLVVPRAALAEQADALGLPRVKDMAQRFVAYQWLEIGWGDEGFYRHVPDVTALTLPLALRALFGRDNPSVLHVVGLALEPEAVFARSDMVRVSMNAAQLGAIARRMEETLAAGDDGRPVELGPGLYGPSLFFRAIGAYHLTQNCNHWVARLMNAAGLPVSLTAATASAGLMADLRLRSGAAR